jgi:flavorubredoxin
MKVEKLFNKSGHTWLVMGGDPGRRNEVIDTNQYLIEFAGHGLLLDPGGIESFSIVATEFSKHFDLSKVEAIFASHQDPDVISSLSFWLQANPNLVVYVPKIWVSFITHYGVALDNIRPVPDEGAWINLGSHELELLPAHYLHSSGNLSLYDPKAKILFSGDIGAAILPDDKTDLFVTDFDQHVQYMDYFHRRWMPSNAAKANWVAQVRQREVDMICPQHGSIFKGEDVGRFLDWFERLDVGSGWQKIAVNHISSFLFFWPVPLHFKE